MYKIFVVHVYEMNFELDPSTSVDLTNPLVPEKAPKKRGRPRKVRVESEHLSDAFPASFLEEPPVDLFMKEPDGKLPDAALTGPGKRLQIMYLENPERVKHAIAFVKGGEGALDLEGMTEADCEMVIAIVNREKHAKLDSRMASKALNAGTGLLDTVLGVQGHLSKEVAEDELLQDAWADVMREDLLGWMSSHIKVAALYLVHIADAIRETAMAGQAHPIAPDA